MNRRLAQNLSVILTSLLLAFFLWAVATEGDNPTVEQAFPTAVPIEIVGIPDGQTCYDTENIKARVTLRAPQSVWESLRPEDVHAFIDVSQVGPGPHTLPVQVEIRRGPAQLVRVNPVEYHVVLEPIAERQVPVVIIPQGTPALGYISRTPTYAPRSVTVRGPTSIISNVARVQVVVPVSDQRKEIKGDYLPIAVDETGTPISNLEILPRIITVYIPIEQLVNFRNLAVKVNLIGQPAPGYRVDSVEVDPPAVTVFGSNEIVQAVPGYLETTPISLTNLTGTLECTSTLKAPQALTILPRPDVSVTVKLEPIEGTVTLEITPQISGLAPGLTATIDSPTVMVTLSGPLSQLSRATPDTVQVYLDLNSLPIGNHLLPPQATVPDTLHIEEIRPNPLLVQIRRISKKP
jgi:YbbR domain-containing protein